MFLKALDLQGFKSFPDKTSLKFGGGITAVVGPNGSGKSNISDAVRWVLGEQSSKSLRGSRMEDVVFGGTTVRKAQGFAEVTLTLDNKDRSLKFDTDEVTVTRRYYRSGESDYILNRQTVRLRDIHEIFMDTGLGKDGYSIISQGKIADIISSRSEDRREIFEEAAGISKFRYRRNDAQKRLTQAEDNLIRLRDILNELETRIEPLRIQSGKAEKFLLLANEKKELEIGLWLYTLEKSKTELREQETKIALAAHQHEQAEESLALIEAEIESVIAEIQAQTAQADELRRETARQEEDAVRRESEILVLQNTLLHNNETIDRISKDMEQASYTKQHMDDQIEERLRSIREWEAVIAEKKSLQNEIGERIRTVQAQQELLSAELLALSEELAALNARLTDRRVAASKAASSLEEIRLRTGNIDESILARQIQAEEWKNKKKDAAENLALCSARGQELANTLAGYRYKLNVKTEKLQKRKDEWDRLQLEYHKKQQRAAMLEDLEKNMEGYSGSVKAVIREFERGALRGIHGPVSRLMHVPEEYAVAIETALGAAMQNIVATHEEAAKSAIGFLKSRNLGRATFLPLTSIKGNSLREAGLPQQEGFIGIASALIEYEEIYDGIFQNLLGRTAVTENLDQAVDIAKKHGYRFRIVTLDGQLVNAGGSLTGGSQARSAGILSRANEIKELRQECNDLVKEIAALDGSLKALRQETAAAEAEHLGVQAELLEAQEQRIRAESELALTGSHLETALNSIRELKEEKENTGARISALTAAKLEADRDAAVLQAEAEALEIRMAESQSGREALAAQRQRYNEDSAAYDLEILAAEKSIDACNEALETLNRRKFGHAERVVQIRAEIWGIEEKNRQIEAEILEIGESITHIKEQAKASRTQIEAVLAARSGREKRSAELRQLERLKSGEREKLSGEMARLEERKAAMLREYDETIAKLYDEYGLTRREAVQVGQKIEDIPKAARRLNELKNNIRDLGTVNVGAIEEYKEVKERYEFMKGQIDDIEQSRHELLKMIAELTSQMGEQFKARFAQINRHFSEIFVELFGGGSAALSFDDPADVLESGIEIRVQPPGKNVQNIDLFSGGEKALSAIALLFAILKVTPSPFCVFDEVEAALDDVNVDRYAQYIRRMTGDTQFILITHRRGTMEEADVLYGVTMQEEGVSKLLELRTSEMAMKLGIGS